MEQSFFFLEHSGRMEKSNAPQLLEAVKKTNPSVSSKFDALFVLVHTILQDFGFKLVGLGEDGPCVGKLFFYFSSSRGKTAPC